MVQFGEGNFLRAFIDWKIDILNEVADFNGDVAVVQPIAQGMGDLINQQDGLYHVLLEGIYKGEKTQQTRLITSVRGVTNPYEAYAEFLALAEGESLEFIISNTTEAGIAYEEEDFVEGKCPKTYPGKLTAFLWHRFNHFNEQPPKDLVVLPCEIINKNGEKLKECLLSYAQHCSPTAPLTG